MTAKPAANPAKTRLSPGTETEPGRQTQDELLSKSDETLFVRAERIIQSSGWFTLCFTAYPILVLVLLPGSIALLVYMPFIGGPVAFISAGVLIVPWIVYRRHLRSLHGRMIDAREGLICGNCWYDLAGIDSTLCPRCGTPRVRGAQ